MKKRGLTIVILVILTVIIAVIVVDFLNNRPDRRGANPYALEVDHYKEVDPELISHKETRKFSLGLLMDLPFFIRRLYVSGNSTMVVMPSDGSPANWRFFPILLPGGGGAYIFIGYETMWLNMIAEKLVKEWADLGERTVITNLAIKERRSTWLMQATRIVIYTTRRVKFRAFEGKAETEAGHGFIVPSANFDLVVNSFGELWVVNPGKHALENYSDDGRMRGFWENASMEIDGFLGCCNPARITVLEDGSFVTSEKGLVRIKIYDQSGKLISVVAPRSF